MASPSSRQELIDYCKRQLGAPVLQINIADEQTSDIIDDAIQFYHEHHFDGLEKMYLKHNITDLDITRFTTQNEVTQTVNPDATGWEHRKNFLEIPEHVMGISKVFGVSSNFVRNELFGMTNQFFLMDMFSFSNGFKMGNFDLTNFYMVKQYFETLDQVINTGSFVQYRFTKRQDRLYIDIDTSRLVEGNWILIDCWGAIDPDTYTQVYNDSFIKRYATALMKRQWGANLIKYNNVQLPGGITLNGRQIWEDGNREVQQLEADMLSKYSLPPMDMIG